MGYLLNSYFSLHGSEVEQSYIRGLFDQFESAKTMGAYHLALFAYHLLFMCFLYETLYKIKLWFPVEHNMAFVSFSAQQRKKFRDAKNSTDYVGEHNRERSLFEFLNIFCDCETLVSKCKSLVDYRNKNLGHANYELADENIFENKITEYDQTASEIHGLTHNQLAKVFDEYVAKLAPDEKITKDDLELNLIDLNNLSDADLGCLAAECEIKSGQNTYGKIKSILQNDFGVDICLETK